MAKESAGLLIYRKQADHFEFLLVHPGGPLWKNKDKGAWTIPKGEIQPGEDPLQAARRECEEEVGFRAEGEFIPLTSIRQKAGKLVRAWAVEGDLDVANVKSNTFSMEWPPRSGKRQEFPEIDQVAFFQLELAREKINTAQVALLEQLTQKLREM